MKKSFVRVFAAVCFIAAGAFFMGCSSSAGGDFTPKYAVGDIVLNDGTKVAYSVAKDYADDSQELKDLKKNAVAVIFRADTESAPALGVGIKHETNGLAWCIKDAAGYGTKFTDTFSRPDKGTEKGSFTFKNSLNTDGSKNLMIMARTLDNTQGTENDTGLSKIRGNYVLPEKGEGQTISNFFYNMLKENYPAFEFAYYYGKNDEHNITSGSDFENGWYLPSLSELNDIYQANKTGKGVIEEALEKTGGNKFVDYYWSSSQSSLGSKNCYALGFYFVDGDIIDWYKDDNENFYTCAVRAFN